MVRYGGPRPGGWVRRESDRQARRPTTTSVGSRGIVDIRSIVGRIRGRPRAARSTRGGHARGQSVVEFALILPVALLMIGVTIDVARVYFAWIDLESGARQAAQWLAGDPAHTTTGGYYDSTDTTNYCNNAFPCASQPTTDAKLAVDKATSSSFTKVYSLPNCGTATVPTVYGSITSLNTSVAAGGSQGYPVATARVRACLPFRTLFAYPFFTSNGVWHLSVDRTFSVIVGR
jgi:Flp pilus assembly protein TadG